MVKIPDALKPTTDQMSGHLLSFLSVHAPRRAYHWWMAPDLETERELPYVPVSWYLARNSVNALRGWEEIDGFEESGLRPAHYRRAAIMGIEQDVMDDLQVREGGEHALAYALGSAVMVAALPDGFGYESDDPGRYKVADRVGKGMLLTVPGLWIADERRIVTSEEALHVVRVVPTEEVPSTVPML